MDPLDQAKDSLRKSRRSGRVPSAVSHALDSIAGSLIVIAERLETTTTASDTPMITREDVELTTRRLLDNFKLSPKDKKSQ